MWSSTFVPGLSLSRTCCAYVFHTRVFARLSHERVTCAGHFFCFQSSSKRKKSSVVKWKKEIEISSDFCPSSINAWSQTKRSFSAPFASTMSGLERELFFGNVFTTFAGSCDILVSTLQKLISNSWGKHKANQYHDGDFITDKTYSRQEHIGFYIKLSS